MMLGMAVGLMRWTWCKRFELPIFDRKLFSYITDKPIINVILEYHVT